MTSTVLILGASGKIGSHAATAFRNAGWNVRLYDRKAGNMQQAAMGADVIVNGLNPPNYHNWDKIIPEITQQVIAAAKASRATVIIPGNVYNYGVEQGPWDQNTPWRPVSRKGQIRVEMERAYKDSGVQTIVLRAGNFLDPEKNGDIGTLMLFRAIDKGAFTYPGDPNALQAYCYLPDWARAALALAERRATLAQFEDVPLGGLALTASEFRAIASDVLDQDLKMKAFPWWAMKLASPFWELARELQEMRYLWSHHHSLSTEKLHELVPGFQATPARTVIETILKP